jgi:hypothetical protein
VYSQVFSFARGFSVDSLSEDKRRIAAFAVVATLATLVLLTVGVGNDLAVTSAKGCEIASWARNIAAGVGFTSGTHWMGEVAGEVGPGTHYPPLAALLYSLPLSLFGEGAFGVLLPSFLLFLLLPVWILRQGDAAGIGRFTLVFAAAAIALFPPFLHSAFQPDGELLVALLGGLVFAALFRSQEEWDCFWIGLLSGAALLVTLDAIALAPACLVGLWLGSGEGGGGQPFGKKALWLFAGWVPGLLALAIFLGWAAHSGGASGGLASAFWLLESSRNLGVQRVPISPMLWSSPEVPGGVVGLFLDGLVEHSKAAVGSAPIWAWGVLAIGMLTGRDTLRNRVAVALVAWASIWGWRAFRQAETSEAFYLVAIWLLILSIETLIRILEAVARYNRITPPLKTAALGTLLLITWWPGFFEIRNIRYTLNPERVELETLWADRIMELTEPESILITDTPERLAWRTGRRTVWLPATPSLLDRFDSTGTDMAVVLSGSIQNAPDVDPQWWELFESGQGAEPFSEVLLDAETYCQVWLRPEDSEALFSK